MFTIALIAGDQAQDVAGFGRREDTPNKFTGANRRLRFGLVRCGFQVIHSILSAVAQFGSLGGWCAHPKL
jgi:hypothetical protein